ncbi:starch-binding protein [uncultured Clostridium sp.]|uniref:starch-binding protein n=1 Tax=uncultured Clostridium sp. TaxID=59620 RepID=UPI0025ECFBC7|nr:starch-binding protein [uncultured Clostridium sp.]
MNLKKVKDILGLTMVFAVLVSNNIVMASTSDISNFGQASKASTIINSLKNGNDYESGGRLTNNLLNINNRISDKLEVHVKNDSWNGAPNIYVYTGDGNTAVKYAENWPGAAMTAEGDGWYTYKTDKIASGKVIFNGSWGQYPGVNQPGLDLSGEVWILNNHIVEKPEKGTVNVKYVDKETGVEIGNSEVLTGQIGTKYNVAPKNIDGYKLVSTPSNSTGEFTSDDKTVVFEYSKLSKEDSLIVHVKNDSWNGAPNIYVYTGDGNTAVKYTGNWPGTAMTAEGDGWYTFTTDKIVSGKVIFNGSWGQYPGANQAGIELSGEVWMLNNTIVENPNKNIKTVEENNSKIVYSGAWEEKVNSSYSNSTEKYAYEAGANLSFTFKGDGIRILSTLASNKGVAKVFIDGEVYSADMFNDVMEYKGVAFEKTDLTNSVHTVYIEYTGLYGFDSTAATISIDAFEIFNGDIL